MKVFVVLFTASVVYAIWYFCFAHPCIEEREYECEVPMCMTYATIQSGTVSTTFCSSYMNVKSTCSECLQRK